MKSHAGVFAVLVLGILVGAFLVGGRTPPVFSADEKESAVIPHYSVVETEGHNLIVTDNHTNRLYFYTIDRDEEIGSVLHLRGTVELREVGKRVIAPRLSRAEK